MILLNCESSVRVGHSLCEGVEEREGAGVHNMKVEHF